MVDYIMIHESGWNPLSHNYASDNCGEEQVTCLFRGPGETEATLETLKSSFQQMLDFFYYIRGHNDGQYVRLGDGDPVRGAYRFWLANRGY